MPLILAALLAAQLPSKEFRPGPLSQTWRTAIRRDLDTQLRDEPSTRYRWPAVLPPKPPGSKNTVYCAWLNGKNSFGAYAGWRPFLVTIFDGKLEVRVEDTTKDMVLTDVMCTGAGYDWKTPPAE